MPDNPQQSAVPAPGAGPRPGAGHGKPSIWTLGGLWARLSNMRFALWLILLLALGGVLGVAVGDIYPTNVENWQELARRKAGPALYPVLNFFQLFDAFRSWWFRGLMLLLGLSLLACAIKRAKGVWRRALFASWLERSRFYERYDDRATYESSAADPLDLIASPLRRLFYRVQRRAGPDGTLLMAADRGGPSRFGPFLSHAGLLLLLVGGLASTVFGLKTMLWLAPGEKVHALSSSEEEGRGHEVRLPFELSLRDFAIELNDEGMIKQYRSMVTVAPDGASPFERTIAVNDPLRFAGFNFYQASYQTLRDRVSDLKVAVLDTGGVEIAPAQQVRFDEPFPLPGGDLQAEAVRFLPHAMVGPNGLQNASGEHRNPAFLFRILRDGKEIGQQWSFVAYPTMRIGSWTERSLAVRDYEPAYLTGLEVTKAPAAGLIWAGILLCTIGLIATFMFAHRQVWALAEPDGKGGWRVHVAAFTNKGQYLFAGDFRRWAQAWSRGDGVRNLRLPGATPSKGQKS